jgi:hypothetical protein
MKRVLACICVFTLISVSVTGHCKSNDDRGPWSKRKMAHANYNGRTRKRRSISAGDVDPPGIWTERTASERLNRYIWLGICADRTKAT